MRHKQKIAVSILLLTSINLMLNNHVYANTAIGRYLTVENKPEHAQANLLSQVVQMRFPSAVQTVGDAVHYVLRSSGYSLVSPNVQSLALKNMLAKPLPAVDRHLGPMPLKTALEVLVGPAFNLQEDPLNRTVDFHVKPQFKKFEHPKSKKSFQVKN